MLLTINREKCKSSKETESLKSSINFQVPNKINWLGIIFKIISWCIFIFIIWFEFYILYKTSDIDQGEFINYMDDICPVYNSTDYFSSIDNINNNYMTRDSCKYLVGYIDYEDKNNDVYKKLILEIKNKYNLEGIAFYDGKINILF